MIYYVVGAILVAVAGVILALENRAILTLLVMLIVSFVLLDGANARLKVLTHPRIHRVNGQVIKSSYKTYRRRMIWKLHCDGTDLFTDSRLWGYIGTRKVYTLWYVWIGKKRWVVAYELDPGNGRQSHLEL